MGDEPETALTEDALLGGALKYRQPRRGFRVTIDAPTLALAALELAPPASGTLLDAGCGVGTVGLAFLLHRPAWRGTLLELQPALAGLARDSAAASGAANAAVLAGDLRDPAAAPGPFDLILCNPPYFAAGANTLPENEQKRLAKFEVALTLAELPGLLAARLATGGRALCIVPWERRAALAGGPLAVRAVRPVLHASGEPPGRALVLLGGPPAAEDPAPLVLYADREAKRFTPALEQFLSGRGIGLL